MQFENPGGEPPATGTAGVNFASPNPVVVDVEDALGDITARSTVRSRWQLANNATGVFLGTLTVNAVNGVATFNNLEIDTAGTYMLEATSPGLNPGLSTSITIDPAAPAQVIWVNQPPTEETAGVPFGITLDVEDRFGNLETSDTESVSLALSLSGILDNGPLAGTDTVALSGGAATFNNVIINVAGDPYTLAATTVTSAISSPASSPIQVVSPVLTPATQGSSGALTETAGVSFSLTYDALTYQGTIDTYFNGLVNLSIPAGDGPAGAMFAAGSQLTSTAANGVATFNPVILDTAGSYVLQAASDPSDTVQATAGDTDVTVVAAAASQLVITVPPPYSPATVTAGAGFGLTVEAEDPFGNITDYTGTVTVKILTGPTGKTLGGVTNAALNSGVAVFAGLTLDKAADDYTLQASIPGLTSATTDDIDVVAAAPSKLVIVTQPPSSFTAGTTFPLVVDIEDQYGNLNVNNYSGTVSLAFANNASGSISGNSIAVTSGGIASFPSVLITTAGTFQLIASSSPALTTAKSTSFTVNPGLATQFAWLAQPPASVIHNFDFAVALAVEDQYGNVETSDEDTASLGFQNNPTGATLEGTTMIGLAGGIAQFSGLAVNMVGNNYTLIASSGTLTSPTSDEFDVVPTPAASLVVTTQPLSSVTVAAPFGLVVSALDEFGNPDGDFTGAVTVSVASGPSQTLSGTNLTVNATNGTATFSGLSLTTVGSYTLSITTSTAGVTGTTTNSFQIVAATASKLAIAAQPPGQFSAGAPFGFLVDAQDQFGNTATGFSGNVTVKVASGPSNTIGGTLTVAANAGVVSFAGLVLDTAGTYTLSVSSPGLTGTTTASFTVSAQSATQLVFSGQPGATETAGVSFPVTVTAEDQFGNVAPTYDSPVTIALAGGPAGTTLGGTLQVTANQGVAQFSGLVITTEASGYMIDTSASGLIGTSSSPFAVQATTPVALAVTIEPPTVMQAGSLFGLAIAAEDKYGNIATQFTGEVAIGLDYNPTNANLNGPLTAQAVAGVANFHAFITTTTPTGAAGYTLLATSQGLSSVVAGPVTVVAATPAQVAVITEPPGNVAPGATFTVVVAIEDKFGNVETGDNGQIQITAPSASGSTIGGTTTLTASGGVVSFGNLTLTQTSNPVSLQITSPGLGGTSTNAITVTTQTGQSGSGGSSGSGGGSQGGSGSGNQGGSGTSSIPLVTLDTINDITKKHKLTGIVLNFSGALDSTEAQTISTYSLIFAGKKNSFTAKNAKKIKLSSAAYNSSADSVTLTLKKPLKLTKPLEVVVDGVGSSGLHDAEGRLIDGANNGQAGSNAVGTITKNSVTIDAISVGPDVVDALAEHGELVSLAKRRKL